MPWRTASQETEKVSIRFQCSRREALLSSTLLSHFSLHLPNASRAAIPALWARLQAMLQGVLPCWKQKHMQKQSFYKSNSNCDSNNSNSHNSHNRHDSMLAHLPQSFHQTVTLALSKIVLWSMTGIRQRNDRPQWMPSTGWPQLYPEKLQMEERDG